jgi:hypothetical protein
MRTAQRWSKHTRLFHNAKRPFYIILYNHYMLKIIKLRNQVPKLKFKILLIIQHSIIEILKVLRYNFNI